MKKNNKLKIIDHIAELRRRLIVVAVVNLVAILLSYQFIEVIFQLILNLNNGMELVYIAPSELFLVYVRLSIVAGIIISSPITALQIWLFVGKGLYKKEKLYIVFVFLLGIAFFAVGVVFCYSVVLPITLNYFKSIATTGVTAMISIDSFVSFITSMVVSFGVMFELPVITLLLSIIGLVKSTFLKKQKAIIIMVIFVASAFITPPDVVSLIFLSIPMIILVEFSIGITIVVEKVKSKRKLKRGY